MCVFVWGKVCWERDCLSASAIMRQRPDEDVSSSSQRVFWVKSGAAAAWLCCRWTTYRPGRNTFPPAGGDSNKDGLKHRRTVTEVCVCLPSVCCAPPPPPSRFLKSASERNPTHFLHQVQSASLPPPCHCGRDVSTGYIATQHAARVTRPKLAGQICSGNNNI